MRGVTKVTWIGHLVALIMMSELVEAQRGTLLNTTDRVLGSAVSFELFRSPLLMVWIRSHPDLHVSLHFDVILNCLFQQDIRNKTMLKWIFIVLGFVLVMTLVGVWWRVSSSNETLYFYNLMNF